MNNFECKHCKSEFQVFLVKGFPTVWGINPEYCPYCSSDKIEENRLVQCSSPVIFYDDKEKENSK